MYSGLLTWQFSTKNVCILAIHLHDNGVLVAWKSKRLKTGLKVQVFDDYTVIVLV